MARPVPGVQTLERPASYHAGRIAARANRRRWSQGPTIYSLLDSAPAFIRYTPDFFVGVGRMQVEMAFAGRDGLLGMDPSFTTQKEGMTRGACGRAAVSCPPACQGVPPLLVGGVPTGARVPTGG